MNNKLIAQPRPLYPDLIPNSKKTANEEHVEGGDGPTMIKKISLPTIQYFAPSVPNATGSAVIIFPGGGYSSNAITHEGTDIAKKFNEIGVAAFVVKYRIPDDKTMPDKEIGPLQDAQQAIKVVREKAADYNISPQQIGIMGFSAGGHLASTAGTHFKESKIPNEKKTNLRPDFMILVYPVISFQDDIAHQGSRSQLLGKSPSPQKKEIYSNELQITPETPPTFLVHASDDEVVVPANSIRFYENLLKNNVKAELHIYQGGGHGFGLNNETTNDEWFLSCRNWMETNGWLSMSK
ncbi:MAG TPA: alpha/beta hydrolase [Chryseolinea sp.]